MSQHDKIDPQKSLRAIYETGPLLAKAKGELVYIEEYRKSLKAFLMKASSEKSAAMQERDAYADPKYVAHLVAMDAATERHEALRWRMVAAQAAIDVWRSTEASNRGMDRAAT